MTEPLRAVWLGPGEHTVPVHLRTAMEHGAVLIVQAGDDAELTRYFDAIAALALRPPLLVVSASPALQARGAELGVAHWLPAPPGDWDAALAWTRLQHERSTGLQRKLDDRRWTERAKGCLMAAQSLDEAQAHKLLRDTAMHARLQLTQVAQSVVHAAQLAEAVNRAGQQRMLSQRLVKLMAQRAAGIEPRRAKVLQDESAARLEANLMRLHELLAEELPGAALPPLREAWTRLAPCLTGKPDAAKLAEASAAATLLLAAAEALTQTLVESGARPPLRLLNICGRQRLLSQRIAMRALLAGGRSAQDEADFAAALDELEAAPLSDTATRALLAEVRAEWLHLLHALRHGGSNASAAALARSSELLLTQLDALTLRYQQSLQTLLS
ncbi:ANTAR domain-containing protein [Paucibacter sp. R3-3]|uniref:ANTAR domain-containing protein n=1 Tax=Roseateles agri TaxID=3098619 RepID=A0ABU5DCW6_9BURK|nr:ANTAR domain-containing protein [Paucibacter sp. R3-3]MDY0744113.1 ANTAR domain-containing protein [Paucibacter sp. R3-3]